MKQILSFAAILTLALSAFADEKKDEPKKLVEIPTHALVMVVMDRSFAPGFFRFLLAASVPAAVVARMRRIRPSSSAWTSAFST